jgi:hypothetical protein
MTKIFQTQKFRKFFREIEDVSNVPGHFRFKLLKPTSRSDSVMCNIPQQTQLQKLSKFILVLLILMAIENPHLTLDDNTEKSYLCLPRLPSPLSSDL